MIADEEIDANKFTRLELPKRIFAPIRRGQANISDCVFKDEDTNDVLNRILELTGISVSEEDLVSDENFAGKNCHVFLLTKCKFSGLGEC